MVDTTSKCFRYRSRQRSSMSIFIFSDVMMMMMVMVNASNSFLDFSRTITSNMPSIPNVLTRTASVRLHSQHTESTTTKKRRKNNTGFYYGIREDIFFKPFHDKEEENDNIESSSSLLSLEKSTRQGRKMNPWNNILAKNRSKGLRNVMGETLDEMREMREEITALRQEMALMKKQLSESSGRIIHEDGMMMMEDDELAHHPQGLTGFVARRKRQKEFDQIGMEVEQWATELVQQNGNEEHGWKEVQCNRMFKNKFNKRGNIKCFLKWMPDSRGKHAAKDDGREYPCVQVIASIDAPMQDVCDYLSEESRLPEYNDLVIEHHDIEDISPHSKICWGSSPQILFIKPRDFVTFCHHHWKRDGTQVVVNQAVEHEDAPAVLTEGESKYCRAYALRGANFIAKDPNDPNKTVFTILSHADPGGGLPPWAMKTAVNAVAPIEPFKLFHKIEQRVIASKKDRENRAQNVSSIAGRSSNPGGLSQIGYACFWPNGGGLKEGYLQNALHHQHHDTQQQHSTPTPSESSNPSYNQQQQQQQLSTANNHGESNNAQLMVQEPSENSAEPVSQIKQ